MLIAIDTSTTQIGLAAFDGVRISAELMWFSHQHHTVELAPGLGELLARIGINMTEVRAIGVAIGPGSFTALRVGLSFVKGLALSNQLPIVGIPTLDILVGAQPASKLPCAAVLQAGRGRIALGWYKYSRGGWQAQGAAHVTTVDALAESIEKPTFVVGELTGEERQRLARKKINVVLASPSLSVRRPAVLAEMSWKRWKDGKIDPPASLAPIYLQLGEPIPA